MHFMEVPLFPFFNFWVFLMSGRSRKSLSTSRLKHQRIRHQDGGGGGHHDDGVGDGGEEK